MSRAARGGAGLEEKGRWWSKWGQRLGVCSAGCQEREQPLGLSQFSRPSPSVPRVAPEWWQWLSGGGQGGSDTPPSLGPSLRPLDLEFMKHLSKVVNIIPVIAKADTMTLEEKSEFKQRVRRPLLLFLSPPFPFLWSKPCPLLDYYTPPLPTQLLFSH